MVLKKELSQVKPERKCSLENDLVEKGENPKLNKWFGQRIALCNQSILALWLKTGIP